MQISERSETFATNTYRYGFNGMEQDDEVSGSGNSYDFGARIYDSRLGRWLALDPLFQNYPSFSDYTFAINSPILFYDANGKVIIKSKKFKEKKEAAFKIFSSTEAAQTLLKQFASASSGDYTADEDGELARHTLTFNTKTGNAQGLTEFFIKIDGEWKEYKPKKHGSIVTKQSEFQIVASVNSGFAATTGTEAVVLNHEAFLWVKTYAEILSKLQSGEILPTEFAKELEVMNTWEWVENKYGDIFNPESDLQKAHSSMLETLAEKLITEPKSDEDKEHNNKINLLIEDVKESIEHEKNNHADSDPAENEEE
jgi:RHS repeat-associated protein